MFRPLSPITAMLIRELQEVKVMIEDVKTKMENLDIEEEIEKKKKKS